MGDETISVQAGGQVTVYFELKSASSNDGVVEYQDLIVGNAQKVRTNPDGKFQLSRIGDAVAAPNTHGYLGCLETSQGLVNDPVAGVENTMKKDEIPSWIILISQKRCLKNVFTRL